MSTQPIRLAEPAVPERAPDPVLAALVRSAAAGDTAAFEVLYRRHAGYVFAICRRIAGSAARAEELAQEAFVRAWRALPALAEPEGFAGWLARIALRVSLDEQRARVRRPEDAVPDDFETAASPTVPGLRLDLERAIDALPAGARAVFVMHDIEGLTHGEIAALLGVAEATSKSQLHRARQLLREVLK